MGTLRRMRPVVDDPAMEQVVAHWLELKLMCELTFNKVEATCMSNIRNRVYKRNEKKGRPGRRWWLSWVKAKAQIQTTKSAAEGDSCGRGRAKSRGKKTYTREKATKANGS